jgi:protein TonB
MDVTDVLRDRMDEPAGLDRMVMLSVTAHVVLIAAILVAPSRWGRRNESPRTVMTITLGGGAPGPANTGKTQIGGAAVQTTRPPDESKRPEPVRPAAPKTPEMTLPAPRAKPARTPPPVVKQAPNDARGRTPTRGAEERSGSTSVDTGARGQGFGLATGGMAGAGSFLDVSDFCCPEYIQTMVERIRRNWDPHAEIIGETVVKFTITRTGAMVETIVEKSSGNFVLDLAAQRAIYTTRQLPPLPEKFTNPTLTVHLSFQYQR